MEQSHVVGKPGAGRPLLTRRRFLQVGASTTFGLALKSLLPVAEARATMGRVTTAYLRVHSEPSRTSKRAGWQRQDDVLTVTGEVVDSEGRRWAEIPRGYVDAAEVQPVENKTNAIVTGIGESGFIGEITVPFTDARRRPSPGAAIVYRLYYSSTIWVRGLEYDAERLAWYELYDERLGIHSYAPAAGIRRVPASEMAALSPEVEDKKIVVGLGQQHLTAFEDGREVFSAPISSGRLYIPDGEAAPRSWTPVGSFAVERKMPTRHMGNGEVGGSDYELPGVPWVSYFHWKGFAVHGAWWHNDFGRPRSAGCINMRPADALWIYRWSQPPPLPDRELTTGAGTRVEIAAE